MKFILPWLAAIAACAQPAGQEASCFAEIHRLEARQKLSPNDAAIETDLALNLFVLGQTGLFHAALARALELDPQSAQAHYLSGRFSLEADQNPSAASAAFRKVLELSPASFKAHYYLGVCLRQLARYDEAREEFRKAGQPGAYSWPFRALAEMELDLNRAPAALEPARKAVELEPRSADNHLIAGKVYQALGQTEAAISAWQEAAGLDPLWETPHFLLGNLYLAQPDTGGQGKRELEEFRKLEGQDHPRGTGGEARVWPAPQARSREELDAFGSAVLSPDARTTIRASEDFLSRFADSEFRGKALELEFEAFRQRNDYAPAVAVGKSVVAADPANALVLARLALTIAERNDKASFPLAEEYASRAIAAANATPRPDRLSRADFRGWKGDAIASAHAARGLMALRRNDAAAAVLGLEEAVASRPAADGSDYLRLGEAFAMKGDAGRAREALARAQSLGPAIVAEAAGKQLALVENSGSAAELFARARGLEKEGKLREAAAAYETAARTDPKLAEAYHNLGLVYYRLGDYKQSADRLNTALQIKPGLAGSNLFLGLSLFRLGEFQRSAAALQTALQADPHSRESYLFLIRDQIAMGRFGPDTALHALHEFPEDAELNYTIGLACIERIREIAATANDSGPDSAEFFWLNLRRAEERQQSAPVEEYRRAAVPAAEPALIREYDNLAALLKSCFDSVLAHDPMSAAAHSIRGYMHESRNEVEEALDQFRQAGDHFAAGRLLAQNVRLKEAETELRAALEADPQNDRAKADLGRLYLQEDQTDKALEILRQIVQRYPGDAYAWADLGKAEARVSASEEAILHLRKALELNPTLYQIHYQLAMLYRKQGKDEIARQELQEFQRVKK